MLAEKHRTSINYLRLPIFSGTRRNTIPDPYHFQYIEKGNRIDVTIKNGNLSPFHRKLFLILEKLYIQKHPHFESLFVRTSFREIIKEMNSKSNIHGNIIQALEDLQNVNIKSIITYKTNDGHLETEEGKMFSLFPNVSWKTTKGYNARSLENKRKYTNYIDVYFQDFHIQNLKNKYYRLINYDLVRRLSLKTLRVYDFLNLNAYYYENNRYKQKRKLRVKYPNLIQYLLLKEHSKPSYIEAQLSDKFDELVEKGVLTKYYFDHEYYPTMIDLYLAPSINLWVKREVKPEELDDLKQYTLIEKDLHDLGLSNKQIDKITAAFPEEYIQQKIDQIAYLLQNIPHRIQGTASYTYNSIVDDWKDEDYEGHIVEEKQLELKLISRQKNEKLREESKAYEEYLTQCAEERRGALTEEEAAEIEREVEQRIVNNPICQERKEAEAFYRDVFTLDIIREFYIDPLPFDEWKERIRK